MKDADTFAGLLVRVPTEMGLEFALTTHGDVAIVAHLRPFSCQLLPCLVLSFLDVGLASLHGVHVHATQFALELVLATADGVLLLRLAAHGNITSRAQYPVLEETRVGEMRDVGECLLTAAAAAAAERLNR